MRRTLIVQLVIVLVAISCFMPRRALAHVLIQDSTVNVGAVLHINPDDDPVAGQSSELYFDIQDANSRVRIPYEGYQLLVTDETGQTKQIVTSFHDTNVIATYVFPTQGLYRLELKSAPKYDQFQKVSLRYSLRVGRGIGHVTSRSYDWTSPLIIGSLGGVVLLAVLVINNRKQIARQSTW